MASPLSKSAAKKPARRRSKRTSFLWEKDCPVKGSPVIRVEPDQHAPPPGASMGPEAEDGPHSPKVLVLPATLLSKKSYAISIGLSREEFMRVDIVRCGCGLPLCRGWQVVAPGCAPLYPVPPDPA